VKRNCDICGKVIPVARLEALPETKRCVECSREKGSDFVAKRTEIGMDADTYKDLLGATRS
jgi:RNA polymerase-binding transcription factor DksA